MKEPIRFNLNGKPVELNVDVDRMLLWVLRVDLGLTGTKYGCGENYCGACSVLVDGEVVRSCQTAVSAVRNKSVITIEGLATNGKPHPLQKAFMDNDALQCGYCTPGMVMATHALLHEHPEPTDQEIRAGLTGNICRCTGYVKIVDAVKLAAKRISENG